MPRKYFVTTLIATLVIFAVSSLVPMNAIAQSDCASSYEVEYGDYLAAIARECNVTLAALIAANPQLEDPNLIYRGQVINIPSLKPPEADQPVDLEVGDQTVSAGATTTVIGTNFPVYTPVNVGAGVRGSELSVSRQVLSGADGTFQARLIIPVDARPEENWIVQAVAYRGSKRLTARARLEIRPEEEPVISRYDVRSGDTMREIAVEFNTTVNALLRANPEITDPSLIYPGQEILLPGALEIDSDSGRRVYIVNHGDTLREIAFHFGLTVDDLLNANPRVSERSLILPGQRLTIPEPLVRDPETGKLAYIVQSGDSLSEIAVKFNTTVEGLLQANPEIELRSIIYPGQVLIIPTLND